MDAGHDLVTDWMDCWLCRAWWQDIMRPGARHQTIEEFDQEVKRVHHET